jgi:four helix bundle protein
LVIWSFGCLVIWSFGYWVISSKIVQEPTFFGTGCVSKKVMSDQSEILKKRTMSFAITALRLVDTLPRTVAGDVVARQLARSATSIGSNYRAVCTARSRAEFIAKLGIVVEESEESVYWIDIIIGAELLTPDRIRAIKVEAKELRTRPTFHVQIR